MEGMKPKVAHHGFTHSTITHHADGSHTIQHHHHEGSHKDVHHAKADHDGMIDSMMEHTGKPNPGEAAADGGDHGVPAEHAAPAGLPMPPGGVPPAAPGA